MGNQEPFETGDLIAVFGGEVGKEGRTVAPPIICRVLVVGELDLLVEEASGRFSRISNYLVPKKISMKLKMNPDDLDTATTLEPKIGDLVLSYTQDSFKNEKAVKITGILFKVTYKMGKPYTCTLLSEDEMKDVHADGLIVLQRKS